MNSDKNIKKEQLDEHNINKEISTEYIANTKSSKWKKSGVCNTINDCLYKKSWKNPRI